jgi:hypothetical protein
MSVGFPCYDCKHQREVPGNAHIQCVADWTSQEVLDIMRASSEHGRRNGWFFFPFVYDPIWADEVGRGPVSCAKFSRASA